MIVLTKVKREMKKNMGILGNKYCYLCRNKIEGKVRSGVILIMEREVLFFGLMVKKCILCLDCGEKIKNEIRRIFYDSLSKEYNKNFI